MGGDHSPLDIEPAGHRKREKARSRTVPRGYESVDGILLTEPRIEAIRRELQAILKVVEFEVDGKPVDIDGFHLRNLKDWADFPTSLSDIFWHLSSVCNFHCEFCYEKGNPEDFPIQNLTRMASLAEIDTRLKYYDIDRQCGLFSVRTAINEPFVNKHAVEVLRKIRARNPNELISFVTNGSLLSDAALDAIADLAPVFFNLSLYSTDPKVRREVLGDARPQNAVTAVAKLAARRIPYMANLVMWPSISFEDMRRSIAYLDAHGAALIRVCLGGYSRYLEGPFDRFAAEDFWPDVVAEVEAVRPSCAAPLLIEPSSYVRRDDAPVLDGVMPGSPAALAGLTRGDAITAVNGKKVATRMQLSAALRRAAGARAGRFRPPGVAADPGPIRAKDDIVVVIDVVRDSTFRRAELRRFAPEAMMSYPYGAIAEYDDFIFGLVITDGLRYSVLQRARDIIDEARASQSLVLSSQMMAPILTSMAQKSRVFEGRRVDIVAAENLYFGGTINIGDLLVVSDFVSAINRYEAAQGRPDLVLVPASPFASSPWQRDLCGVPAQDIERLTGVPTRLVDCQTITF